MCRAMVLAASSIVHTVVCSLNLERTLTCAVASDIPGGDVLLGCKACCMRLESRSAERNTSLGFSHTMRLGVSSVVCVMFVRGSSGAFIDVPASRRPLRKGGDLRD